MFSTMVTTDIKSILETRIYTVPAQTQKEGGEIFQKLAAFEKLLQHAMARFSKESLYHVLRIVTRWAHAQHSRQTPRAGSPWLNFKIKSLDQIRDIIESMRQSFKQFSATHEEEQAVKYLSTFLKDFLYLRDLKQYFNDEILHELERYQYDPFKDSSAADGKKGSWSRNTADEDDSGHGSQVEGDDINQTAKNISQRRRVGKAASFKKTTKSSKQFEETVKELLGISRQWEGLLVDGDLNLNDFDPDSYYELIQFVDYSHFEPILRLVPDIFTKCHKCIALARTWAKESNTILKELPKKDRTPTPPPLQEEPVLEETGEESSFEYIKQVREVQTQILDIDASMVEDEYTLVDFDRQLEDLQAKEERFLKISESFEKMDSLVAVAADNFEKVRSIQFALADKLKEIPKSSPQYSELKEELKQLDLEVTKNHWKMKMLEFEKSLVQEDYLIELEMRPSFIRFVGDMQEKITDLQNFMQEKRDQKRRLEKNLALLKTNTDSMRKIMRTYLGSASTHAEGVDSRQMSTLSQISEYYLENPNEGDMDSAGPFDSTPGRSGVKAEPSLQDSSQLPNVASSGQESETETSNSPEAMELSGPLESIKKVGVGAKSTSSKNKPVSITVAKSTQRKSKDEDNQSGNTKQPQPSRKPANAQKAPVITTKKLARPAGGNAKVHKVKESKKVPRPAIKPRKVWDTT